MILVARLIPRPTLPRSALRKSDRALHSFIPSEQQHGAAQPQHTYTELERPTKRWMDGKSLHAERRFHLVACGDVGQVPNRTSRTRTGSPLAATGTTSKPRQRRPRTTKATAHLPPQHYSLHNFSPKINFRLVCLCCLALQSRNSDWFLVSKIEFI